MLLPTQDQYLEQFIHNAIFAAKQGNISPQSACNHILKHLDDEGYHKGLPTSIEWALNSGDGVYRP